MNLQEKLFLLEDLLEVEKGSLHTETELTSLEEWDSVAAISFVILLADQFDRHISGKIIRSFTKIADLVAEMK